MTTDGNLIESTKVRELQRKLYVKAKEEPRQRFHAVYDKVWRLDFLHEAYRQVRANGGAAGVDGEGYSDIEAYGAERWLRELAKELRDGSYKPQAVREVLIPKKQPGKWRALGIPCIRDRVVQTSAMLVVSPIFEADLQTEQYAYRPQRSAKDAVQQVHRLLNQGHQEVVDADLSNFFGEIPHAELMKSMARRISDGKMLGLIKMWLEMPIETDDGKGGKGRSNRARKEHKGTPQGSPISPMLSNIYMRRFILGWKQLGFARRFNAEIVNFADDFCVLGKAPAQQMLAGVEELMKRLKLPINVEKTRCLRCPDEPLEFLGYRFGWNYRPKGKGRYIGTSPSKASVQSMCRKISEQTASRWTPMSSELMVKRLNQQLVGWGNYFTLGRVSPAYKTVDMHTRMRLRQWLCRKHKLKSGKYVRFSNTRMYADFGLLQLESTTTSLPWVKT